MKKKSILLFLVLLNFSVLSAQEVVQSQGALGSDTGHVKVVDNRGTISYLQATNGITKRINTTPVGGLVATWKLGGTLTEDTFITLDGKKFALVGANGVDLATYVLATHATVNTSGYTLLVRNEADGEVETLVISDLVDQGTAEVVVSGGAGVVTAINSTQTFTGFPFPLGSEVSLYRNGVKLRVGDYAATVPTVGLDGSILVNLELYDGDVLQAVFTKLSY